MTGDLWQWGAVGGLALALTGAAIAAPPVELDPRHSASWELPNPDLYGVDLVGDRAWAVGYWGAVLFSEDGGESWSRAETPVDRTLFAVSFADEQSGWAVGDGGVILRSTDGGRSWTRQQAVATNRFGEEAPLRSDLFDVEAIGPRTAWTVGNFGVVLRTTDGRSWEQIPIPESAFADENLPDRIFNAVRFTDRQTGWIAGEFGTVLRTTDGGESWTGERTFEGIANPELYIFDLAVAGDGRALGVGTGGSLIQTTDGGRTWTGEQPPTTAGLFTISSCRDRDLSAGDRGIVMVRREGSERWSAPEHPKLFNWIGGSACNHERAFLVGENGLVLRSDDEGERWVQKFGREPPPLGGVSEPDPGRSKPSVELPDRGP